MSLTLGDNFSYQASKPLDARLKYDTVAAMKAVADSTMYEGCLAYCVATDKTYQWKSTNTVDATLGKWREFSSGGHAVEDSEGTALTPRDTMQFGDGFNATDDSENEKTVVEPNLMTAADMDDVVTPLPSVQSRYHKYSTEEQIVGEWIDGKPLYQKTFVVTNQTMPAAKHVTKILIANQSSHDYDLKNAFGFVDSNGAYGGIQMLPISSLNADNGSIYWTCDVRQISAASDAKQPIKIMMLNATGGDIGNITIYVTIQYTKTTD